MKNLFKKQSNQLNLNNVGKILTSGAAAGMAIAQFAGKKGNSGGVIGAGLSLLIGGILVAIEEDNAKNSITHD